MMPQFWNLGMGAQEGLPRRLRALPTWARLLLALAALPGAVLLALSLLGILVSLLVLLLLTAPVYALVTGVMGATGGGSPANPEPAEAGPSPGVKRVEASIVE